MQGRHGAETPTRKSFVRTSNPQDVFDTAIGRLGMEPPGFPQQSWTAQQEHCAVCQPPPGALQAVSLSLPLTFLEVTFLLCYT